MYLNQITYYFDVQVVDTFLVVTTMASLTKRKNHPEIVLQDEILLYFLEVEVKNGKAPSLASPANTRLCQTV